MEDVPAELIQATHALLREREMRAVHQQRSNAIWDFISGDPKASVGLRAMTDAAREQLARDNPRLRRALEQFGA